MYIENTDMDRSLSTDTGNYDNDSYIWYIVYHNKAEQDI